MASDEEWENYILDGWDQGGVLSDEELEMFATILNERYDSVEEVNALDELGEWDSEMVDVSNEVVRRLNAEASIQRAAYRLARREVLGEGEANMADREQLVKRFDEAAEVVGYVSEWLDIYYYKVEYAAGKIGELDFEDSKQLKSAMMRLSQSMDKMGDKAADLSNWASALEQHAKNEMEEQEELNEEA